MRRHAAPIRSILLLVVLLGTIAACGPVQGGGGGSQGPNTTPAPSLDRTNY